MILLTLASKQIWPQLLAVASLKPTRLVLLHSSEPAESRGPAQRLKRLFDDIKLVPRGGTRLEEIPDSDIDAIERRLDDLQIQLQTPLSDCVMNVTGGNKLMAMAAFRWGVRHACVIYLERRNQLTWFSAPDGRMVTRSERIDGAITNNLDPVALLRCQLEASEVERAGQMVTLNDAGQALAPELLFRRVLAGSDLRPWLRIEGIADRVPNEGDSLEFATAAVLLKLGVFRIQRSLRLKVKSGPQSGTRVPHAEIDLVFTWRGRLWLVDCKDRIPAENLADSLRRMLPRLPGAAADLFDRIRQELAIGQTKVMKEDLIAVREVGGLMGQVVCVRRALPADEVLQYAHLNGIEVVAKEELVDGWERLLFPDRAADAAQLRKWASRFGEA